MAFEMNIVKYLHYNAKEFGDCIAYVYNEIEYSWKEIDILSNKAAIILEKNGIQKLKHVWYLWNEFHRVDSFLLWFIKSRSSACFN